MEGTIPASSGTRRGNGGPNGDGWGGPARGAGSGSPRAQELGKGRKHRPDDEVAAAKARSADRIARMKGVLETIAEDEAAPPPARVNAAVALLNREEGMPVQRNENTHDGGIQVVIHRLAEGKD